MTNVHSSIMSIAVSSRCQAVLTRTKVIRITERIYEGESLFTIEKVKTLLFYKKSPIKSHMDLWMTITASSFIFDKNASSVVSEA